MKHASFPTTKTKLKIFLGMCNVYRRCVKDVSEQAKPLNAMTRAEVPPDFPKVPVGLRSVPSTKSRIRAAPVVG